MILARILNALRPNHILINNSRIGLDAVANFGRGLSQYSHIYCTYFSLSHLGASYAARFPYKTLPYSTALTDNSLMESTLHRMWNGMTEKHVAVLPPRIDVSTQERFDERLRNRIIHNRTRSVMKWVWVGRIEKFKGTDILGKLATTRSNDAFYLFGPAQEPLHQLGLTLPNIAHSGILDDVLSADFSEFNGFIFTSLFEGMPNTVLEMSQHAIPMILADVGGLRDTFDDSSVIFVEHATSGVEDTAKLFSAALDRLLMMPAAKIEEMVKAAFTQVALRHSPEAYSRQFTKIFGN